jgi:hypothetical protein
VQVDGPRTNPDRPLRPEEILCREDLTSEAQTLGPDVGNRSMREGGIAIGRPRIVILRPGELPEVMRRRPGIAERAFVMTHLLFDLEEMRGSRRYREARFQVVLNVPDSVAHSLWPMLVTTEAEVERTRTFGVQLDLSFGAVEGAPSLELGRDTVFRFTSLQPVITAFGVGQRQFSWTFSSQPTADLEPGNRSVFAMLDLPTGTPSITGTFEWEVGVARDRMGRTGRVSARTRAVPFRIMLASGETTLVQPEDYVPDPPEGQ